MKDDPIEVDNENKIKIKPDLMIAEKLYPFIHENSVFLFFKDESHLIHCYEISNKEIKDEILKNPEKIIELLEEANEQKDKQ